MKIGLIFPPVWDCDRPYPSLAMLGAFLRQYGYEVLIKDLNIELQNRMLSNEWINCVIDELEHVAINSSDNISRNVAERALALYDGLGTVDINLAKNILRACENNISKIMSAKRLLKNVRYIVSAPFAPASFTDSGYFGIREVTNIPALLEEVYDLKHNIFYNPLKKSIDDFVKCDIVGISMTGIGQLVPGFTLITLLKKYLPTIKIVIGGAMMPYMRHSFLHSPEIFSLVDAVIVGEGETPLKEWLRVIKGEKLLSEVPNLLYKSDTGKIVESTHISEENLDELPLPDYDDFPWEKYFSGKGICYISSRGCPWNKCSFCSLTTNYGRKYRVRNVIKVVEDLKVLQERYNRHFVIFDDEALTPERVKSISETIIQNKLNITWTSLARFDKNFDKTIFSLAYNAGLRMLTYGLESGSQSVLHRMNKGTNLKEIQRILSESSKAGIWNNVFLMFGFPGETLEEFKETLGFLERNEDLIDSLTYTDFRVEGGSEVFNYPAKFGLHIDIADDKTFGPLYEYKAIDGSQTEDRVWQMMNEFQNITENKHYNSTNITGYDWVTVLLAIEEKGKSNIRREIFEKISEKNRINKLFSKGELENLLIKPEQHIQIINVGINKSKISNSFLLYNTKNHMSLEVNSSAVTIFKMSNHFSNVAQITKQFANLHKQNYEFVSNDITKILKIFCTVNYMSVE